jgi:hypothetical protein
MYVNSDEAKYCLKQTQIRQTKKIKNHVANGEVRSTVLYRTGGFYRKRRFTDTYSTSRPATLRKFMSPDSTMRPKSISDRWITVPAFCFDRCELSNADEIFSESNIAEGSKPQTIKLVSFNCINS